MRPADSLLPYLTAQVEAIVQLEPLVREDVPDSLHKMRVACRRLRSCLLAFGDWFADDSVADLLDDLKWLGGALAETRDLEVVSARVRVTTHAAGDEAARRLAAAILDRREQALKESIAALDDERYTRLLNRLQRLIDQPEWAPTAQEPAAEVFRGVIRREWKRVAKAMAKARTAETPEGHEERLHEVRKRIRRARYVTEVARPALGWRCGRLTTRFVAVQDILGRHNDSVVASEVLLRVAGDDPDAEKVAHQLALDAVREDARFTRAFERLEGSWILRRFA